MKLELTTSISTSTLLYTMLSLAKNDMLDDAQMNEIQGVFIDVFERMFS